MSDDKARTKWVALLVVVGGALYLCWRMLQPFVGVLLWAGVLTIVFAPLQRALTARTGKPGLSAGLTLLGAILLFVIPVGLLGSVLVGQLADLAERGPARVQAFLAEHPTSEWRAMLPESVARYVDVEALLSAEAIRGYAQKASSVLVTKTMSVVGGALGVLVNLLLVLYTTLFLLKDGGRFVEWAVRLLPLDHERSRELLSRTQEILKASVFGTLVIAVIQGALGTVMFLILGVPSAVLWGTLMVVTALIPVIGTGIVWAPAAVLLALTGSWGKALVLVIWGVAAIGMADNLLRPRLVGSRIRMHDLLVFLSVLGGIQAFGFLGMLLGPVVLAVAMGLLEVVLGHQEAPAGEASPSPTPAV